jgi:hypothetical protein
MVLAQSLRMAALAALLHSPTAGLAQEETAETLPDFPGREETFGYCIACHSMTVVGRQGMDRARWDETLNWMADKHGMPAPDPEMRKTLLVYLSQACPPKAPAQGGGWVNPFAPKP